MKYMISLFILTLMTIPGNSQVEQDKAFHFAAGALSGAIVAGIADELSEGNKFWTLTGAVAGSLLAGIAKESLDEYEYQGWDNGDLAATVLGGISVGVTIDVFSGKKRKLRQEVILVRK